MKKIYSLALSILFSTTIVTAQNDCSGDRYKADITQLPIITPAIPFGIAEISVDSINSDSVGLFPLLMDVYQPGLDIGSAPRPVIVMAFGGAFVYGARISPDIVELCTRFSKMGYVMVSIDYRLSDELLLSPNPANATRAVLKGTHDMKAAVRFLRRQAAELGNVYNIDTNQIYVGGVSAGAFCALHTAYLGEGEAPPILQQELDRTGGLEGSSGNPGYSSKVAGVINLCGALGEKEWLDPGDVPLVSMHGDADDVVPYDEDTVRILDINYPVAGSAAIKRRADDIGVENPFYTFVGAGHVPFVLNAAYMDTTFRFVREFMYKQVCNKSLTGVKTKNIGKNLKIYPNPSTDFITLNTERTKNIKVVDTQGKVLFYLEPSQNETVLNVNHFKTGVYFIEHTALDGTISTERFIKQ